MSFILHLRAGNLKEKYNWYRYHLLPCASHLPKHFTCVTLVIVYKILRAKYDYAHFIGEEMGLSEESNSANANKLVNSGIKIRTQI